MFWINDRCINCGTCWQFDPDHFSPSGERACVAVQPVDAPEAQQALLALQACPVAAIETERELRNTTPTDGFPVVIHEHPLGTVQYCGWASRRSFGACSWLITRPSGNVMVDVPRWSAPLARRIKDLGGLQFILLTHRDDVADHELWARSFRCERWIHAADADAAPQAEQRLKGHDALEIAEGLQLIPTPGHTQGSLCALLGDARSVLFSGDHLWWNPEQAVVVASERYCWWDFASQLQSIERLLELDVALLLPGHGRRHAFAPGAWRTALEQTLNWSRRHHEP
ncbi:MBL fold metallo-hydrolase [Synechococcus sp. A10-1-5-9]|uniref:MBL fold metallo-hydrolase n=1 Tax=Synechococcus sp. A10-1-5-9 TaxID=3392295 RepID=UPI0039ED7096